MLRLEEKLGSASAVEVVNLEQLNVVAGRDTGKMTGNVGESGQKIELSSESEEDEEMYVVQSSSLVEETLSSFLTISSLTVAPTFCFFIAMLKSKQAIMCVSEFEAIAVGEGVFDS